jgi:hypothetical protein
MGKKTQTDVAPHRYRVPYITSPNNGIYSIYNICNKEPGHKRKDSYIARTGTPMT